MNNWINGAIATCAFEIKRSFTAQRAAVSVALVLFPPVMLLLLVARGDIASGAAMSTIRDFARIITVCLVSLVCLLSLLLWATPNVLSEIEGKSWGFVASRPGGRVANFLGKFLVAFLMSFAVSIISFSLCVFLAHRRLHIEKSQELWIALLGIYFFACIVYAAVFSLIGTIFIKRAMVVATGYVLGSDVFLASIPGAMINKFTIRFHLQEIGINWIGWFLPSPSTETEYRMLFGDVFPVWGHILILLAISVTALIAGGLIIVNREYITSDES